MRKIIDSAQGRAKQTAGRLERTDSLTHDLWYPGTASEFSVTKKNSADRHSYKIELSR